MHHRRLMLSGRRHAVKQAKAESNVAISFLLRYDAAVMAAATTPLPSIAAAAAAARQPRTMRTSGLCRSRSMDWPLQDSRAQLHIVVHFSYSNPLLVFPKHCRSTRVAAPTPALSPQRPHRQREHQPLPALHEHAAQTPPPPAPSCLPLPRAAQLLGRCMEEAPSRCWSLLLQQVLGLQASCPPLLLLPVTLLLAASGPAMQPELLQA